MLSSEEIQHIAQLARIKLTEKEKDKFKKELSLILDYVKKLSELDTEKVEPLYQTTGIVNALRPDEYRKDFEMDDPVRGKAPAKGGSSADHALRAGRTSNGMNEKLIGQAPQSENRFIKVKSVLKK